jgi:hypothetical protein
VNATLVASFPNFGRLMGDIELLDQMLADFGAAAA